MSQILIRGGTVIDGTGAPAFKADVRVRGGDIVAVAPGLSPEAGERVVDASGCFVTPGFIESHTHFDGTMWWQPDMDPLPGYGITTSIMGNCGFTAAPISEDVEAQQEMIGIFSFFEDIPKEPFTQNLPWNWRKWSEYWKSLGENVRTPVNSGAFVGHIAIRLAVMGMDAWERAATPAEIARMAEHLDDALAAGAMGLSSNLLDHDGENRPIPTLKADDAEFAALIDVLARYPGRTLQIALDIFMKMSGPEEVDRLARLIGDRPIRVQAAGALPMLHYQESLRERMVAQFKGLRAQGRDFWAGYAHVPSTSTISLIKTLFFAQGDVFPWHEVVVAETEAAKIAILKDPEWRARARAALDATKRGIFSRLDHLYFLSSDTGAGPLGVNLTDYAKETGLHPSDAMAEWFLKNGIGSTIEKKPMPLHHETLMYAFRDPMTVGNINDSGAHGQMLCGGGENMVLFTEFVRRGDITMEEAVHIQTGKLADHFFLADRGKIQVGKRADIAVFNYDEIDVRPRKKAWDVPDGKGGLMWRWTRDPAPVRLTLVNGVPTFEDGKVTGERPGALIAPSTPQPQARAAE